MNTKNLDGKVALITGSSRGIGFATAKLMAEAGATVVISSRDAESCENACLNLTKKGLKAIAVPAHIGRPDAREALCNDVLERLGGVDIFVANAATNPIFAPLQDTPTDVWQKIIETNVTGVMHICQLLLPQMAERGGGAVVFVSSIASDVAVVPSGAYAISKAAGNHMVVQLAAEWGKKNIRVNCVSPGTTRTDMIRALIDKKGGEDSSAAATMLGRIAEPEDVAAVISFLCSPAARHVTAQVINVDGGQTKMVAG